MNELSIFKDEDSGELHYLTHYVQLSRPYQIGKENTLLSDVSKIQLLTSVADHVRSICTDETHALQVSPYYRVYCTYDYTLPGMTKGLKDSITDIYQWFETLMDFVDGNKMFTRHDREIMSDLIITDSEGQVLSDPAHFHGGAHILYSDLLVVKMFLSHNSNCFGVANINGHVFHGRGSAFAENNGLKDISPFGAQHKKFVTQNLKNNLRSVLTKKELTKDRSSWCKYKSGPNIKCGQLNYFFRLWIPGDNVLHGTPMANIVCRRHVVEKYVVRVNCGLDDQAFPHLGKFDMFIPVTSIYPSAQLVAPFDSGNNPLSIIKAHPDRRSLIHHLYLLDLYPQCSGYMYERDSHPLYNNLSFDVS